MLITPNEANQRHGIGIIVERFFGHLPNTLSIRSHNSFGGEQRFGTHQRLISQTGRTRAESRELLRHVLHGSTVRRILCIPFFPDDLVTALCLQELSGAPLGIYVMDDNNIGAHGIPDELLREALGKAQLRLGISPEIREAYEAKFGLRFFVMPPLVERERLCVEPRVPPFGGGSCLPAALVGNVWSQQWLERLRATVRGSGLKLAWYGNTQASWLHYSEAELAADGIIPAGFLPEPELIERLRAHPFAVIPSGSLDEHDDRPELARLSLPSRIPYLMGVANLPLIVLGHPETAAGHFVEHFKLGRIAPYDGSSLREAAGRICQPEEQTRIRRQAAAIGPAFTLDRPGEWLWDSLAKGAPHDDRFEKLMPRIRR